MGMMVDGRIIVKREEAAEGEVEAEEAEVEAAEEAALDELADPELLHPHRAAAAAMPMKAAITGFLGSIIVWLLAR